MRSLIIFDLDGTLADTAPDLIATLNRVVGPYDVLPVEISHVGQIIGHGAKAMIGKAFELSKKELSAHLHDQLFEEFLADYGENIDNQTRLFDGLVPALEHLEKDGHSFAVCTNKKHSMAVKLLERLGVAESFEAVTGGDSYDFRKPDARHLTRTAELAGHSISQSIMIGDSETDINAAKNAGIPSIAVTFGYSDKPVTLLGADCIIDHFDELTAAIHKLR